MRWWLHLLVALAVPVVDAADEPADWFRVAQGYVAKGEQARAVERYKSIVRHYPRSTWANRAQLEVAQLYARNREFEEAFEAAQKLVESSPESALYTAAVELQFAMTERVAEEYRRRRLKKDKSERDLPSREGASLMLRKIVAHARYTEHAPKAQFRLAVSLDEEKQRADAIKELNVFLQHYPDHDLADDAAFQVAFIDYRSSRDQNRERAAGERATLAFEEFLIGHPQSEKGPEARHLLSTLKKWETERLIVAARYYEHDGRIDAALRTYREALKSTGDEAETVVLQERIESLTR